MNEPRNPSGARRTSMQGLMYLAVGAVATLVHWATLAAEVEWAGWPAWAASGAGALVGAQVAYVGNRHVTFAPVAEAPWVASWWRFQVTAIVGGALGMGIVAGGVGLGLHYLAAQCLATAAVLVAGFAVNRCWSFRAPGPGARAPGWRSPDPR